MHRMLGRRQGRSGLVLFIALTLLMAIATQLPASAGTLTSASFAASTGYKYTSAQNNRYDWGFTTATTSNLTRFTAGVPAGTSATNRYLALPNDQSNTNNAETPDSATNSITGALDVRVNATAIDWTPSNFGVLSMKWSGPSDYTYWFGLEIDGKITLGRSNDGSATTFATSSVSTAFTDGTAHWVRVTYLPNDGGGNRVTTFYTSADGSSWSTLGTAVTQVGTSTNFNSAAPVNVGGSGGQAFVGKIYYAEVRNGIGGTVANSFDPNDAPPTSPSTWASSRTAETWSLNRNGPDLKADIAADLTVQQVLGIPTNGTATLRMVDGVALYTFASTSVPASTASSLGLSGFTNTATAGSYTSLIKTWDASSTPAMVDSVTTSALAFTDASNTIAMDAIVDPMLTFTVAGRATACNGATPTVTATGTAVALGHASVGTNQIGAQDLTVVTNAANGFTVNVRNSAVLSDGHGHSIANVGGTNAAPVAFPSPGTAAVGYTTSEAALGTGTPNRFTNGGPKWAPLTTTNAEVSYSASGPTSHAVCLAYEVGMASTTVAGNYTTTVIYTAVPKY